MAPGFDDIAVIIPQYGHLTLCQPSGSISSECLSHIFCISKDSDKNLANYLVMWNELAFQFWDRQFEQSIVNGKPSLSMYDWFNEEPGRWRLFQKAITELASISAYEVVEKTKISSSNSGSSTMKIIDVGGGHGLYSIEYCKRNSNLSAIIFDLPLALELAKENIRK